GSLRGFSGDGGAASTAELHTPLGVAVDSAGNIYIADSANNRIREITPVPQLTITAATPTLAINDSSGTYNGATYAASVTIAGTVAGTDSVPSGSLESVTPSV